MTYELKKSPKKLCIVNTVYGDASGGRWQAMLNTTRALEALGHQVLMLTGSENQHLIGCRTDVTVMNNAGFYDWIAAWRVRHWLKQVQPDVIIAHSGRAVYLLKHAVGRMNIPVLAVNHSHNVKRTLLADGFIHITPHVQHLVNQGLQKKGKPAKPEQVISNLVDVPDGVQPIQSMSQPLTIGMMTRLVDYKGVQVLIDAVAVLKTQGIEVNVLIAGEGEYKPTLQEQVHGLVLESQVVFLGWVCGQQKLDFYHAVDVIAVPSFNDTQPLSSLDAFAWGKVLISSDAIGPRQVCQHEVNGLLFCCGDHNDLALQIKRLINDPALVKQLAAQGFQEARERYAFDRVAAQIDCFLCDIVMQGTSA